MIDGATPRIKINREERFGQTVAVVRCGDCHEVLISVPQQVSQALPRAIAREMEGDYWAHKPSCTGPVAPRAASSAT